MSDVTRHDFTYFPSGRVIELDREEGKYVLHSDYAALKEAASRSLDDAYNSFGDREEAHERLIDVAKLVVKSWNTVELGALKDAIDDMTTLVGEEGK